VAPADSRMAIRGQAETSRHYSISRPPEMSNAAPSKPVLIIDRSRFANFDGFKREFSILLSDYPWGISTHSTMCYGGASVLPKAASSCGGPTPTGPDVHWVQATAKRLESLLETCHPSNRAAVAGRLSNARAEQGPKLFDEIVDIIR
jgi:hypothetical protein